MRSNITEVNNKSIENNTYNFGCILRNNLSTQILCCFSGKVKKMVSIIIHNKNITTKNQLENDCDEEKKTFPFTYYLVNNNNNK